MQEADPLAGAAMSSGTAGGEIVVVGAGLIGLAVADALAERGAPVALVSVERPGEASAAGAGMLAPTVEPLPGSARDFAVAARDRFPRYLRALEERTGITVPLDRGGILEVAHGEARAERLRSEAGAERLHRGLGAEPSHRRAADTLHWLETDEVAELEPALGPVLGALLHPLDGAVDNVALLHALRASVAARREIRRLEAAALAVERDTVHLASGTALRGAAVVLAAGAWTARLRGLPRPLPVEPARGQMIALGVGLLRHVIYAEHGYLVPRPDGRTLVGATMEQVGFDTSTTPQALERLHGDAARVVPALRAAPVIAGWAGLRPMSPDALPILGRDPDWPTLLYACGHSRNGILMTPLTGEVIASLALGEEPTMDLSAFSIGRFRATRPGETG